jgi:hypothetical protein
MLPHFLWLPVQMRTRLRHATEVFEDQLRQSGINGEVARELARTYRLANKELISQLNFSKHECRLHRQEKHPGFILSWSSTLTSGAAIEERAASSRCPSTSSTTSMDSPFPMYSDIGMDARSLVISSLVIGKYKVKVVPFPSSL